MYPYQVLAESAKEQKPEGSFLEVWNDFACWERSRGFADDPSAPSKNTIDWIRSLYELSTQLDDYSGAAKADCLSALESASAAFARLDHGPEICQALKRWREYRRQESEDETFESSGLHS